MKALPTFEVTSEVTHIIQQAAFIKQHQLSISPYGVQSLDNIVNCLNLWDLETAADICSECKQRARDNSLPHEVFREWQSAIYAIRDFMRQPTTCRPPNLREFIETRIASMQTQPAYSETW